MNDFTPSPSPIADRASDLPRTLWDDYRKLLLRQHVKPNAARWYVRRVEHFVQRHRDVPLDRLAAVDINAHLDQTLRDDKLLAWQALQTVDALQQFCNLCNPNAAGNVDWDDWRRSARSLPDERARRGDMDIRQIKEDAADSHLVRKISPRIGEWIKRLVVAIRLKGYAYSTEKSYGEWVMRFLSRQGQTDPNSLDESHVRAFIEDLVVRGNVAASTQNQAVCALVFFFAHVLERPLGDFSDFARSRKPRRLPVVLTQREVASLLTSIESTFGLMASLMYGTGRRLRECVRVRVQDVDFSYQQITIRDGKGGKDRRVPLPGSLSEPLRAHLVRVKILHDRDLQEGVGDVVLPDALSRKFRGAGNSCFPASPSRRTRAPEKSYVATTYIEPDCNGRSRRQPGAWVSPSA